MVAKGRMFEMPALSEIYKLYVRPHLDCGDVICKIPA